MNSTEFMKELNITRMKIRKELKNLENSIKGTTKLDDLEDIEIDFDDLKDQFEILDEELEELEEILTEEEFEASQIYQEPISLATFGLGSWQ